MWSWFSWTGRVKAWWRDTPIAIRWVAYVCVPLGFLAVGLGVYGDGHHWWDDRSFLTNLASSFTSLLFGVPTALIALSHLSAVQAEASDRRSARNRAEVAVREFRYALMHGFRDAATRSQRSLAEALMRLDQVNRELMLALSQSNADLVQQKYQERDAAMSQLLDSGFRLGSERFEAWLEEISIAWHRLDREIRPRLEELGLRWMEPRAYLVVRKAVVALEPPPHFGRRSMVERLLSDLLSTEDGRRDNAFATLLKQTKEVHTCLTSLFDMVGQSRAFRHVGT
ncbi:hypothetical protein SAZ11_28940 [Streptomyces sp. FXJ1.4098]|uniref:hypothetical protein n=1 Tax=Streptomyces sp. NPDC020845 TaxID=3365096 RepID=UPI0029980A75|nr:hypothetical protein [Streptomyces sp. FXJ1.4098]